MGKGGVAVQVKGMRRAGSTAQRDQYPVWPCQVGRGARRQVLTALWEVGLPLWWCLLDWEVRSPSGGGGLQEGLRAVGGVTAQSVLLSHL